MAKQQPEKDGSSGQAQMLGEEGQRRWFLGGEATGSFGRVRGALSRGGEEAKDGADRSAAGDECAPKVGQRVRQLCRAYVLRGELADDVRLKGAQVSTCE